jgi:hypothetical protein
MAVLALGKKIFVEITEYFKEISAYLLKSFPLEDSEQIIFI